MRLNEDYILQMVWFEPSHAEVADILAEECCVKSISRSFKDGVIASTVYTFYNSDDGDIWASIMMNMLFDNVTDS